MKPPLVLKTSIWFDWKIEIYIWILDRKLLLKLNFFLCKIQLLSLGYFWYFCSLIPWYFDTFDTLDTFDPFDNENETTNLKLCRTSDQLISLHKNIILQFFFNLLKINSVCNSTVSWLVRHTFRFPLWWCLWTVTERP